MKLVARLGTVFACCAVLFLPSVSQAQASSPIIIENTDDRSMSDAWCAIDYFIGSWHVYDWEWVSWAPNTRINLLADIGRCGCSGSECTGDCLYSDSPSGTVGRRVAIRKRTGETYNYEDIRIECEFYINGARHYDYEDIGNWNGSASISLELNGWGGSWDENAQCWVGDFLHHR